MQLLFVTSLASKRKENFFFAQDNHHIHETRIALANCIASIPQGFYVAINDTILNIVLKIKVSNERRDKSRK